MDDGACAGNQVSRLRVSKLMAGGELQSTGIQYAALLVDPTYNPPEQTESLPIVGNSVVALAVVNGEGAAPYSRRPRY